MKRFNILSILVLLLAGFLQSCYEDKGNYNYNWRPEIYMPKQTGGFRDTTIARGQRLTIVPELKMILKQQDESQDTINFRPENFSYKWVAYQQTLNDPITVLATTQNLDTIINLSLQNTAYNVIYYVTEKETNVTWSFSFNLKLESRYINAWLFLTEDDNKMVDLTLYGKEIGNTNDAPWVYEHNILKRSGFPYRGGGAKFIYYFSKKSYIYIGTGEATGWLGKNNLDWTDKQMIRYQMAMPQPISFTFENVISLGVWHFIASNGSIYPMDNNLILLSPYNNLPPAVTGSEQYQEVKLAPFVGGVSSRNLVYDETNEVMLIYKGSAGNAGGAPSAVALPENLKLRHHKIYHLQTYATGLTAVIAQNKTNHKYYKYIYDSYATSTNPTLSEPDEIVNGELLDQAENYICDKVNGFFYLSIGNELYVLRKNELKKVTILDNNDIVEGGFKGFDAICLLTRYTDITSTTPYIMLATYVGTENSGKIYYLEPNPIEATELTVKNYYSGLGRVKGISRF